MKTNFNLKTLLVVAILLIMMCVFNTNFVQATNVITDETKTTTDTSKNTVESTTKKDTTTNKTEKAKQTQTKADDNSKTETTKPTTETKKKVEPNKDTLKLIPNTMTVNIKEIEFQKLLSNDSELKKAIMKILTDNNVDMTNYELDVMDNFTNENTNELDIHKFKVFIYNKDSNVDYEKEITVKYSNTDKYNENDGKTIRKIWNYFYWTAYTIDEKWERNFEKVIKEEVKAYDSDIQCIVEEGIGVGGREWSDYVAVNTFYFKNDVFYGGASTSYSQTYEIIVPDEIKDTQEAYTNYAKEWLKKNKIYDASNLTFKDLGNFYELYDADGNYIDFLIIHKKNTIKICDDITMSSNENVTLSAETIKNDSSAYTEMQNKLKDKGYTNVFNAYELKLAEGKIGKDGLTLKFDLGTENNGKQAIVLHKKHDGSYEEFVKTVENGRISITVTELSPFMVALKDKSATTTTNLSTKKLDSEPKAGVTDYTMFASAIAIISLAGIVMLKFKK